MSRRSRGARPAMSSRRSRARAKETAMNEWVLRMPWAGPQEKQTEPLLTREWLVTNGLGGYASGTVVGLPTRRYHGLLTAALPTPLGRQVMLNSLTELVRLTDGTEALLGGEERR